MSRKTPVHDRAARARRQIAPRTRRFRIEINGWRRRHSKTVLRKQARWREVSWGEEFKGKRCTKSLLTPHWPQAEVNGWHWMKENVKVTNFFQSKYKEIQSTFAALTPQSLLQSSSSLSSSSAWLSLSASFIVTNVANGCVSSVTDLPSPVAPLSTVSSPHYPQEWLRPPILHHRPCRPVQPLPVGALGVSGARHTRTPEAASPKPGSADSNRVLYVNPYSTQGVSRQRNSKSKCFQYKFEFKVKKIGTITFFFYFLYKITLLNFNIKYIYTIEYVYTKTEAKTKQYILYIIKVVES